MHDLHLLYKASLALDFSLLPRLFPKTCKAKRKYKQKTKTQQKAHTVLESVSLSGGKLGELSEV